MKKIFSLIGVICIATSAFASSASEIAKKNGLDPSSKTISQWEREFKSPRDDSFKKLIGSISANEKEDLKTFLTDRALDGKKPSAAGSF